MEKNAIYRTGRTTASENDLEQVLFHAQDVHQRALRYKRKGDMDGYYSELGYYLGIRQALQMLGFTVAKDYDFLDLEEECEESNEQ